MGVDTPGTVYLALADDPSRRFDPTRIFTALAVRATALAVWCLGQLPTVREG